MKKISIIFIILVSFSSVVNAGTMLASLSYAVFNTPDNNPYIETYLVIQGSSLGHTKTDDGKFQSTVDISILFRRNDSIVNFGKYELFGTPVKDTAKVKNNLLDVQRYSLPRGDYQMEIQLHDRYGEKDTLVSFAEFSVDYSAGEMTFSDIEFLHSYAKTQQATNLSKNGYELVPYVFDFYPEVADKISFYAELYNSQSEVGEDAFILYYYLRPFETDKKMDQYFYMKKLKGETVNVLLNTIDISQLPSGNYYLVLETWNRNKELLTSTKKYFQRYNPNAQYDVNRLMTINPENSFVSAITSVDSLKLFIDYLYPVSSEVERIFAKSVISDGDMSTMQKYFLNFWTMRDAVDPENAWLNYKERVDQANADFKAIRIKGYRTDRGRVYLQYGRPNVITPSYNEPAAYPYEIWQYYQLDGQHDRKFVFYTRDLATNDFRLIHSNAIGEITNYRWQTEIYSRTWDPYSIDDARYPQTYGSFATDYYLQPR